MRRGARWLVVVAALGGGAAAGARWLRPSGGALHDVPVVEVAETAFIRTVMAEGVLKPVKTTVISAPTEGRDQMMIAWMLDDGDPVKKGDLLVRFDSGEFDRKLADGNAERAAADSRMEKEKTLARSTLHERDRAASVTREELDRSRQLGKKDPRFFPKAEVIESEIDTSLYEARLAHAQRARKIEEQLARSKIDLLAIDRRKADLAHRQAEAALSGIELRAPHDGTFVLQRWGFRGTLRAGDRAYPGMRIAEVSTNLQMDAEVYVLEADAGGLAVGRAAKVIIEARPDIVWPARVKKVDPFPKARQPEVPTQYFATLLRLEGKTDALKPGQRLRATIILDELPKALVVPRQAVFRRDNDTVVFRRAKGRFDPVKVKLGPGTVGRLVIAAGVKPGDFLALRDPTLTAEQAVNAKGAPVQREATGSSGRGERRGGGGRR